ncbi:unnamed protein product [Fusarium graminearum]|uniref:Chromosome 4, complete genome n=1 Tax=Gibberella zeae (strain ATCC MYA-4620 / CBS 123657 / FGSC 9075 / NRRL 31084 / PH-1) TaxID=229533 RepID=A0A1C3YL03_GIBZE|nr:unnamed protein product [Fusarium graminearum]
MELFEDIYKSGKFIDHTCNTDSGDSNSPEDDQEDQHEEDQEIENRKANEDKAVSLATRGQNCPGASSVKDGLVLERCQFLTIIDLDTARLKQRKGKTILEGRCVECQASLREKQLLSRFTNSSLDGLKDVDVNSLRERFTNYTQTKWQVPADYQTVMDIAEKIKAGNRLGTKLVVLDVEFSPVSDQVWEIAVVEFVSGKVVINALVDHGDDIRHTFSSYKTPKLLEEVSKSVHRKVYSQEGRLKKVNVDKIAEELRQGGISPNTVVLVWQWGPRDLQLSQRLLKAGGHDDIWPETCLPLIKQFRLNTPMAKGDKKHFSLKLEILFAVVYPRSGLVGMDHRAVIDCRQTRLLCQAFEDLSLPVDRRKMDWEMEMKPKLIQLTIQDSFQHLQVTNKRTAPNEHHGSSREKRQKGNRD